MVAWRGGVAKEGFSEEGKFQLKPEVEWELVGGVQGEWSCEETWIFS